MNKIEKLAKDVKVAFTAYNDAMAFRNKDMTKIAKTSNALRSASMAYCEALKQQRQSATV